MIIPEHKYGHRIFYIRVQIYADPGDNTQPDRVWCVDTVGYTQTGGVYIYIPKLRVW